MPPPGSTAASVQTQRNFCINPACIIARGTSPPRFHKVSLQYSIVSSQKPRIETLLPNPLPQESQPSTRLSRRHNASTIAPLPLHHLVGHAQVTNDHSNTLHEDQADTDIFINHLRRPLLPMIHILLVFAHLSLSAIAPYLLVKYLIQPMVLWLILVVCLVLQTLYLCPGLILEITAMIKGRPM